MFSDIVILAGGFGERLWPASKADNPKQFLNLGDSYSLIQHAILRALALNPSGKIILATRRDIQESCAEHAERLFPSVTPAQKAKLEKDLIVLAEPCPRHTTAPILLSCYMLDLLEPNKEHSILVLTSDHVIEPVENFASDCEKAYKAAVLNNFVCFAIPPLEPATGYGYIKTGSETDSNTYKIDGFKEKPDAETAKQYLASKNYWWNSGMFGFTSTFLKEEMTKCETRVSEAFDVVKTGKAPILGNTHNVHFIKEWPEMKKAYELTPAIAIDISIAERTKNAYAITTTFNWDDVGSWDAFAKFSTGKANIAADVKSNNCFVYSDIPVALCGVEDLIVVIKNNKALVVKKGESGLVRDAVKTIKD